MPRIKVEGQNAAVTLTEPDEDGDYGWDCSCGEQSESVQPIGDAIAHAEVHLLHRCPLED